MSLSSGVVFGESPQQILSTRNNHIHNSYHMHCTALPDCSLVSFCEIDFRVVDYLLNKIRQMRERISHVVESFLRFIFIRLLLKKD